MTKYHCSNCKSPVTVTDNAVMKACKCNAAVIAEIKATVYSHGRLK